MLWEEQDSSGAEWSLGLVHHRGCLLVSSKFGSFRFGSENFIYGTPTPTPAYNYPPWVVVSDNILNL